MSYRLYVRPIQPFAAEPGPSADQLYSWVLLDASGDAQARGASDSQENIEQTLAQNDLDGVLLVGLIPGEEALFCVADIPAKQSRFIQQALPFAVEEQIAQDIHTVHLAVGKASDEGYRVAAIDDTQMSFWYTLFSDWAHVRLSAIYPDAALLPITKDGWSICLDSESVLLSSDRGEWLSIHSQNLAMFAESLATPASEEVIAEVPVTLFGTESEFEEHQTGISSLTHSTRLVVHKEALELSSLELLAHAHHHHLCDPINLCQGNYSIHSKQQSLFGPWKPAIAVACLWVVVQVTIEIGFGLYHQTKADQVEAQAMEIYRSAFPNDTRTEAGTVRRVVQGQLNRMQSKGPDAGFIALMKYTGQEYSALAEADSLVFNSVNYSANRGELVVDVRADSYAKLSALRNGLSDKGLNADIGSVVNEENGARGRLTVSGG